MAIIGSIVRSLLEVRKNVISEANVPETQEKVLEKLLEKAKNTAFGKYYGFAEIIASGDIQRSFAEKVPYFNYEKINENWWSRIHTGEKDVTWPGSPPYFALSSGTSKSASKHIPVTKDMLRHVRKVGMKQIYSMVNFPIPAKSFEKRVLMLSSTTNLFNRGHYYEGDMSGISTKNIPRWFRYFYKPDNKISYQPDWEQRINLIVQKAPEWDVSIVCGVPAWVQILFEEIIKDHHVGNIHDVWPNLTAYIHGGVSFTPYKESFKKLLGRPISFIETYMASEGSFGFQDKPDVGIKLVLNAGIFFEFIPFNSENFDESGEVRPDAKAYMVYEVVENVNYAVVLSTSAGAWRYLTGDVVRFTDVIEDRITIMGRTKHFLSLYGEHMSIENMNKAVQTASSELNISIKEYTVAGFNYENRFAHHWYIGTNNMNADPQKIRNVLDETLCWINNDYAAKRTASLKEVFVTLLPNEAFIEYMRHKGKEGAMNKFPRVLKNGMIEDWEAFLSAKSYI